jgi:hypothetical protein
MGRESGGETRCCSGRIRSAHLGRSRSPVTSPLYAGKVGGQGAKSATALRPEGPDASAQAFQTFREAVGDLDRGEFKRHEGEDSQCGCPCGCVYPVVPLRGSDHRCRWDQARGGKILEHDGPRSLGAARSAAVHGGLGPDR